MGIEKLEKELECKVTNLEEAKALKAELENANGDEAMILEIMKKYNIDFDSFMTEEGEVDLESLDFVSGGCNAPLQHAVHTAFRWLGNRFGFDIGPHC